MLQAAQLSDRYITGRFLPDKAIDLVDESAAELKMEVFAPLRWGNEGDAMGGTVHFFAPSVHMAEWEFEDWAFAAS